MSHYSCLEGTALPHEGMRTPWGRAQSVTPEAEGIYFVSTASHGGVKVRRDLNNRIPSYMRRPAGWYEEDVEWCLPFVALEAHFLATGTPRAIATIQEGMHVNTFRNWLPDAYEKFYNVVLQPGESSTKDRRTFFAVHQNDWLAVTAWGDWKEGVPKGMVLVLAARGGRRESGTYGVQRCFLVPDEEYTRKEGFVFVIDPSRHQEVPCP